jgi:ELWxxDGT repeat protein
LAPVAIGGELFFVATDVTHGQQLWKGDGTFAGTVQLTDGNGTVYFSAFTTSTGFQVWQSDGTAAGTAMVTGLSGTSASAVNVGNLTNGGGSLYFTGYDATHGYQLRRPTCRMSLPGW